MMKPFLIFVFLFLLMGSLHSLFAQTQLEMNQQAEDSFKRADQQLNLVYSQIVKLYASDSAFIVHLKESERAWIQFRDAQVNMRFPPENNYGSARSMCVYIYLKELTNDRIKILQQWIDGMEEGDICNGSIRAK